MNETLSKNLEIFGTCLGKCIKEQILPDLERKGLTGVHPLYPLPPGGSKEYLRIRKIVMKDEVFHEVAINWCIKRLGEEKKEEKTIISHLPLEKVKLVEDDVLESLQVEFVINPFVLAKEIHTIPENDYKAISFLNPNDYLKEPGFLSKAILTLDEGTFKTLTKKLKEIKCQK